MIRNVTRPWFEVWGTEEAQNRFLKGILVFFVVLSAIQTVALCSLALRKPILIAVTQTQSHALAVEPPGATLLESEAKRTVTKFITAHHSWEGAKIEEQLKTASKYVAPQFAPKFLQANAAQMKIAREKNLSQKFFVSEVTVDLGAKVAHVTGERILLIDGLRAANPMQLDVRFDYGARTEENPEGIYITAEDLVPQSKDGK